uniref:CUB domain-containing protein n=1 Tax=Anopheles farauti TaxID=69004 RepID=A0A182R148_9DIPT
MQITVDRPTGCPAGGARRWACGTSGKFLYINILLVLLQNALLVGGLRKGKLVLPSSYTALGDDLDVQLHADPSELATVERLKLEILRHLPGGAGTVATTLDIRLDANHNVTQIKVPCYHFLHGGQYELAVLEDNASPTRVGQVMDERLRQPLDVGWPSVRLSIVPNRTDTYPDAPIQGVLEFDEVRCQLPTSSGVDTWDLPELWLELFYCGASVESCSRGNLSQPFSPAQVLYTEQVRGLPRRRVIDFRCDLFGLAGFYGLHLKTRTGEPLVDSTMGALLQARALLQADWSKQYVFTVHTRSIFPCDPHGPGIRVLFQYPSCILNQADRVRVYAKLRADVLSLAPPTSLHYIAEQRVSKGTHSLYFECDLFYEKYVEYCFVYVSQAISGAVADIRMDCVPTLPVSASDSGGWGPWSNWTHCSTTCRGGIRNRYRFCDSPPPRYGAKFCECWSKFEVTLTVAVLRMPKEKKPKKPKKAVPEIQPVDGLSAVDRQFYEITINDLNQKLARLRTHNVKIEERNEELESRLKQIEEDRADVTAYLDRTLQEKVGTIVELEDKLSELSKVRDLENEECRKQINALDGKYKAMHEQLTSEIKLLTGKLNSMEEFRLQRDELMAKFDAQDSELKEQNKRHKSTLYEMERKVILDKDRLRKDVENKLLQLSTEFTKSSEIRVAAHTQRLVRENIALNNEMDRMINTQERLQKQFTELRKQNTELRNQADIDIVEKQRLMQTCQERLETIKQLTDQFEAVLHKNGELNAFRLRAGELEDENKATRKDYNQLRQKVRVLEQYVHYINSDRQALRSESEHHRKEFERISDILKTVRYTVRSAFKGEEDDSDLPYQEIKRKRLIADLLNTLNELEMQSRVEQSVETIVASLTELYDQGDLGVIPRESMETILKKTQGCEEASESAIISSSTTVSPAGEADEAAEASKSTLDGASEEGVAIIDVVSGSRLVFLGSNESLQEEAEEAPGSEAEDEDEEEHEDGERRKKELGDEDEDGDFGDDEESQQLPGSAADGDKEGVIGPSVQTERCGLDTSGDSWECMFSPAIGGINLPMEIEDVNTEIGPGCRCGCVIHMGMVKPKRLLGSSSHSCPDRSLWLIKGDDGCRVRMSIDFHKFPCDGQWLKIRDGDSVADELLLQFGADRSAEPAGTMAEATGNMLLVEFFSRKTDQYDEACNAGFLGQAEQIKLVPPMIQPTGNSSTSIASKVIMPIVQSLQSYASFTIAHVCAAIFICFIVLVSFLLVVQYIFRYRKYELATSRMEAADSPAHTLFGSNQSLDNATAPMQSRSRAVSTTTLISEIVSYVKLRPRVTTSIRHERFRESVEYALETTHSRSDVAPSDGSSEIIMELQNRTTDTEERDRPDEGNEETPLQSLNDLNHPNEGRKDPIGTSKERTSPTAAHAVPESDDERSTTVSSAYSSLNREKTPLVGGKGGKFNTTDTLRSDQLVKSATCLMATSSTSTATLTNVSPSDVECCSPPEPSIRSPLARRNTGASIRARSAKDSKEKRNLQKLLAGSDYSLGAPSEQDMELDYYDYNVINAGAAPGSYLGMDPAFLVWIPPLDDGSDEEKKDRNGAAVSDDDAELAEFAKRDIRDDRIGAESRSASITPSEELIRQLAEQKRNDYVIVSNSISKSDICSESDGASTDGKARIPSERRRRKLHELILVRRNAGSGGPGSEPGSGSSVRKSSSDESTEEREKETSFTKSPVDNKQISDFYEMADIAFADDEADEEEEEDEQEHDQDEPPAGFCADHPKGGTILVKEALGSKMYQDVVAGVQRREGEKIVQ